jgi:heme exporter protein D
MYFDSVSAVLEMDGHGVFVWSAYLVTIVVVAALLIAPGCRRRRILRRLSGELKRQRGVLRKLSGEV